MASSPWTVKPSPTFPLNVHRDGWCKKIDGKVRFIAGKIPPEEALKVFYRKMAKWLDEAPPPIPQPQVAQIPQLALPPAPTPPVVAQLTVPQLRDQYTAYKKQECISGKIKPRTLKSIQEVVDPFAEKFPKAVADLTHQDFAGYHNALWKRFNSVFARHRHVIQIRCMFNWAINMEKIPKLPIGPKWFAFEAPSDADKEKYKNQKYEKHGEPIFTPEQVKKLIDAANPVMKAIVLLGINCAFGNSDISELPKVLLNFKDQVIDYSREKTGGKRRCFLWDETVEALKVAMPLRPTPANANDAGLVFLTEEGRRWVEDEPTEPVSMDVDPIVPKNDRLTRQFNDLITRAGITMRPGLSFYSLRKTHRTIADAVKDENACRRVMGHKIAGISGSYVVKVEDDRIRHVADYVHDQIFGKAEEVTIHLSKTETKKVRVSK